MTAEDSSLTISFEPPARVPDDPALEYAASCNPTAGGEAVNATSIVSPVVVSGLTNGSTYLCALTTRTSASESEASLPLAGVAGVGATPWSPTGVWTEPAKNSILVYFDQTDSADATVTGYRARCIEATAVDAAATSHGVGTSAYRSALDSAPGARVNGLSSPITLGGLATDRAYRCDVAASNDLGSSPRSALVLASASPLKPGEFTTPEDMPAFPDSCGGDPQTLIGENGGVLVLNHCDLGDYPVFHLVAAYKGPGRAFSDPTDVGSDLAFCSTCDNFFSRIFDIGRVVYRPVFYADGTAALLFAQRVPGSESPFLGQVALMEATFSADGTFTPAHQIVDKDTFSYTGKWSMAKSPTGDVVIAWEGRQTARTAAYAVRRSYDSQFSEVRYGAIGVGQPYTGLCFTTDNMGFDENGDIVLVGYGLGADQSDADTPGLVAERIDIDTGETTTFSGINSSLYQSGGFLAPWSIQFASNEVTLLIARVTLSDTEVQVATVSLEDGTVRAVSLVGLQPPGIVGAAVSVDRDGNTLVGYYRKVGEGSWQVRSMRRPAGGTFGNDILLAETPKMPADQVPQAQQLPDGYGVVAWRMLQDDGSSNSPVAVLDPLPVAPPASPTRSLADSPSERTTVGVGVLTTAATPGVHFDVVIPGSGSAGAKVDSVVVDRRGLSAVTRRAGSKPALTRVASISARYRRSPSAPRSLRATAWNRTVRLTWAPPAASTSPISSYVVQYSTNGRKWRTATAIEQSTGFSVTGLRNGIRYRFRVLASNGAGTSKWATAIASPAPVAAAPATPSALQSGSEVSISWGAPQFWPQLVTAYRLEVSASGRAWKVLAKSVPPLTRVYAARNLKVGTTYRFRVVPLSGRRAGVASSASASITFT